MKKNFSKLVIYLLLSFFTGVPAIYACGGSGTGCGCAGNSPKIDTATMKCPGSCMCSVGMPSAPKV